MDRIEKTCGWTITTVEQTKLHMTYKRRLNLTLDMSSFQPGSAPRKAIDATVSLNTSAYEAGISNDLSKSSREIHEIFIEAINSQLHTLISSLSRPLDILKLVSSFWSKASIVAEEIRLLQLYYPSEITLAHEHDLGGFAINTTLLLPSLKTKVRVMFEVSFHLADGTQTGRMVSVTPHAAVVYGERFDRAKMQEFLQGYVNPFVLRDAESKKLGGTGNGRWVDAVKALGKALVTRGRVLG